MGFPSLVIDETHDKDPKSTVASLHSLHSQPPTLHAIRTNKPMSHPELPYSVRIFSVVTS